MNSTFASPPPFFAIMRADTDSYGLGLLAPRPLNEAVRDQAWHSTLRDFGKCCHQSVDEKLMVWDSRSTQLRPIFPLSIERVFSQTKDTHSRTR